MLYFPVKLKSSEAVNTAPSGNNGGVIVVNNSNDYQILMQMNYFLPILHFQNY
jgi:hypothetical protein